MDELAKRFADLAEKFGPNVYDAAIGAARMEAISTLFGSVIWLGASICLAYAGRYLWNLKPKDSFSDGIPQAFGGLLFFLAFCCLLTGIWSIIDPWIWTAMTHPELWLAKKVFKL